MLNNYDYIIALLSTFSASLIFTMLVIWLAQKWHIVDKPDPSNPKKLHSHSVALWGGAAIFLAFNLVVFFYSYFTSDLTGDTMTGRNILGIVTGAVFLLIGGLLDDKYNLKPKYQIIFPILAVISVIVCGIGIDSVSNPLGGEAIKLNSWQYNLFWHQGFPYKLTIWADLFTFIWLLCIIYTTKILDGLDGLVSGLTVIASAFIFLISLNNTDIIQYDVALLAIIVMGAYAGFLVFNFNPASIFLGESGSTLAGFLIGSLSIISGSKVGVTLILLSIPILDFFWTIIRRLSEKRSPFSGADRKHLHHRLLDAGFSVKSAVLFFYSICLVFGVLIYNLQDLGLSEIVLITLACLIFMLILAFIYKRIAERQKVLTK